MNRRKQALTIGLLLTGLGLGGGMLSLSGTHARAASGIEVPGDITALPQANGVTYEATLPVADRRVTTRQALDVAEREFALTDSQIDTSARAVPVVLTVGSSLAQKHMKAWVVTANVDMYLPSRPGTHGTRAHKLCVIVDAATGKYILAYPAGPRDTLSS